jgi:hypothetical protein
MQNANERGEMTASTTVAVSWNYVGKAAINLAFVAILGGAAGFVWGAMRHRRELDLASLGDFREAYGRWCAVWRDWSAAIDELPRRKRDPPFPVDDKVWLDLMQRAAEVEGTFEALLVKIATERRLNADQIRRMGRFREGYQQLRESIEKRQEVPFRVQYRAEDVSAYLAFKALSVEFAALLSAPIRVFHSSTWSRPPLPEAQRAFVQVTSWRASHTAADTKHAWWSAKGNKKLLEDLLDQLRKLEL